MCNCPTEIDAEETIVRVIFCPSYIKKGAKGAEDIKLAAFRSSPPGTDEVSVIRQSHMGCDFCKIKAKEIAARRAKEAYTGLAVFRADAVHAAGSTLHDSRNVYCGHAHISHGVIIERDEPPNSEVRLLVDERCMKIRDASSYHADPEPDSDAWTGTNF